MYDGWTFWFRLNKWFDLRVNNYLHFTLFIKQIIILVIKLKMKTLIKPVELFGLIWQNFVIPFWSLNLLDPIGFYCMDKNTLQISSFVFCRKQKIDTRVSKYGELCLLNCLKCEEEVFKNIVCHIHFAILPKYGFFSCHQIQSSVFVYIQTLTSHLVNLWLIL